MNNGDRIRLLNNEGLADVFTTIMQSSLKTTLQRFRLDIDEKLLKELSEEAKANWLAFLNKE